VTLSLDMQNIRNSSDEEKEAFTYLSKDSIEEYGDSSYVKDYYYKNEVSVSAVDIEAVSMENALKPSDDSKNNENNENDFKGEKKLDDMQNSFGDFRLTAYSDPSYIEEFVSGQNKITDGEMFTKDNTDYVVVISSDLAEENDLEVGDTISFYVDEEETYEFKIIGIYTSTSSSESNFMGMNAMNQSNQIYTNMTALEEFIENTDSSDSLSVSYYLNRASDLDGFESELREKGLSDYYTVQTNLDSITESLTPIKNLSSFSLTFLILILIVGTIILAVIHMMNIRERKYEIGVLRAIGMSKGKVTAQLISEILMVSFIALVVGFGVGVVVSQPVTNLVLKNEIENYETSQTKIEENFGGSGFERPGFDSKSDIKNKTNDIEYMDTLEISVDFITILELFGVGLLITVLSGLVTVTYVNKYNPNKILQNR
jgi:putative ABC transport system permease protein